MVTPGIQANCKLTNITTIKTGGFLFNLTVDKKHYLSIIVNSYPIKGSPEMFKTNFVECPCCCKDVSVNQMYLNRKGVNIIGILTCPHCDAIFNVKEQLITLDAAMEVVDLTRWDSGTAEYERYFDFTWIDHTGKIGRSHGWYNPETRMVTQSG